MREKKQYEARYVHIDPYLSVQCGFVFVGDAAVKAQEMQWAADWRHSQKLERESPHGVMLPPMEKMYLRGGRIGNRVSFNLMVLENEMKQVGIHREDFVEWTFLRSQSARVAFCREREYPRDDDGNLLRAADGTPETIPGPLFGFGRPHPFKPNFKSKNPDLAGPLVDHRPGQKDGWNFEPVLVKVMPTIIGVKPYYLELAPKWEGEFLVMEARTALPSQMPERLVEYRPRQKAEEKERAAVAEFDEMVLKQGGQPIGRSRRM